MSGKFKSFINNIKNKKIAVLGLGISNRPLVEYLFDKGIYPDLFDKKQNDKMKKKYYIKDKNNIYFNESYLSHLKGYDIIFKTPSMRHDIPQIKEEEKRGAVVTSEMNEFLKHCPCTIIGITGSDGKSTTTTITAKILDKEYRVWLGGNIGTPLFDRLDEIKKNDIVVLELSSFQLMTIEKSPDISIITNITPNHLDMHKDMDEYINAKKNIIKFQNEKGKAVLNLDNKITGLIYETYKRKSIGFVKNSIKKNCICLIDNKIYYVDDSGKKTEFLDVNKIKLPGTHNIENYMAAIGAVKDFVSISSVRQVAYEFEGLNHRREKVKEINGRTFYNDSIASSPYRTKATLSTFDKVILIAGGKDKNNDYSVVAKSICDKVKNLILVGQTSEKIKQAVKKQLTTDNKLDIYQFNDFTKAVEFSYKISKQGDDILLSPASTSFDLFKNFEQRGNAFKKIVNNFK